MADDRLAIYVLDVGQGDCTFIVPPEGQGAPILVDCNDWYVAERFVANHGIVHLDAVIASHLDRDHIRGIVPFLMNHFAVGRSLGKLIIGIDRQLKGAEQREIAILLRQALAWSSHPPCPGFSLEDPTRGATPRTIAQGTDWSVQLVLPFHATRLESLGLGGEDPNLCSAVIRVVGAKHAFISVGTNNAYGHPDPQEIQAMRGSDTCRARCTQLTPRCHPNPAKLRVDALRVAGGVEWPYRHHARPGDPVRPAPTSECPCAGSMAMWIDPGGKLDGVPPPGGAHDRFLKKIAHARCV
ncbi:MAG TPA: hypothetical protein VH165_25310 [Kofleriaceae bacterium]|jgi:hypothetical protein|nr:hypothetical protein [Kofleriaceae bacterium]